MDASLSDSELVQCPLPLTWVTTSGSHERANRERPPGNGGFSPEEERSLATAIQAGRWAERALQRNAHIRPRTRRRLEELVAEGRRALGWMVEGNARLAYALAERVGRGGLQADEARQAALEGLFHAALRFDPARRTRFSTYAAYWIRQTIQRAARGAHAGLRLPSYVYEQLRLVQECLQDARRTCGAGAEAYTLAAQLASERLAPQRNGYRAQVARRLTAQRLRAIDLAMQAGAPVSLDAEDDDGRTWHERFGAASTEEEALRRMERQVVRAAVMNLTPEERGIIEMMIYREMPAAAAARALGMTPAAVEAGLQAALARLRAAVAPLIIEEAV